MSEEKKPVKKEEAQLATVSAGDLAKLRALSGAAGEQQLPSFATVTINNRKIEKEVDGEIVEVLGPPEFEVREKNDAGEWISLPYAKEFIGVILRVRFKLQKKWKQDDPTPFFYSYEFEGYNHPNGITVIDQSREAIYQGSYAGFKQMFDGRYTNIIIAYTLIDGMVKRVELKGSSFAALMDYLKSFGSNDHVTAHFTKFALGTETKPVRHHVLVPSVVATGMDGEAFDLRDVMQKQQELDAVLSAMASRRTNDKVKQGAKEALEEDISFNQ